MFSVTPQASSLPQGDPDATQVFPTPPPHHPEESSADEINPEDPEFHRIDALFSLLRGEPRPPWEARKNRIQEALEEYPSDTDFIDSAFYDVPLRQPPVAVVISQSQSQ